MYISYSKAHIQCKLLTMKYDAYSENSIETFHKLCDQRETVIRIYLRGV